MKTLCLIALLAAAAGMTARAQPDTNAAPELLRVTDIHADSAYFDGNGHQATYCGNVRVIASGMKLTCALLVADLPQSGGRLSHVVAETNVVIDAKDSKGQTMHATGEKAVYNYDVQNGVTNETVTLTGNPQPQVEIPEGTNSADVIIWDRANNGYRWIGNYHFSQNQNGAPTGTNAPAAMTNEASATHIHLPPEADTNFPPGTLDLVPPLRRTGGSGGL